MPTDRQVGTFRVFVASPGDVQRERDALASVINELNRTLAALLPQTGARLELVRWESNAFPAMGRPQQVINDQIGQYDIFVGVLWKRFGTPTGQAQSGTEEEFRLAYDNWQQHSKPHILFYFNRASMAVPSSTSETEQLAKVVAFREELNSRGLVWEYDGYAAFADVVRPHLTEVVGRLIRSAQEPSPETGMVAVPVEQAPKNEVRAGSRIRITDIGEEDSFYGKRAELINLPATLIEAEMEEGWYMGRVLIDKPLVPNDDLLYPFFQFRFEPLEK